LNYYKSALVALQFLTQIPVVFKQYPDDRTVAASLVFYPWVGALIGGCLVLVAVVFSYFWPTLPSFFSAALILSIWVLLTGALHLDGLADTCDAWLGGIGSKERTLAIMKDPCSGPIAVVVLFCTLLLKLSAIVSIIEADRLSLLLIAPMMARSVLPALLLCTPYVRVQGIGQVLKKYGSKTSVFISSLVALAIASAIGYLLVGLIAIAMSILIRHIALKRLSGLTGDIAGASVEIVESVVIIALVFAVY